MNYFKLILFLFLTTPAFAQETLSITHPLWKDDILIQKDNRFCRVNANYDCGLFIKVDTDTIQLQWDKYKPEIFKATSRTSYHFMRQIPEKNYEDLEYTFSNPFIQINPHTVNPLSVLVRFPTTKPARIEAIVKGRDNTPDLSFSFKKEKEHALFITGLFPEYNNQILLKAIYDDNTQEEKTISVKTDKLNASRTQIPFFQIIHKEDDENHFYFSMDGLVYDEYNNVRYQMPFDDMSYIFKNQYVSESRSKGLSIYTLQGEYIKNIPYPKGFNSFSHGIAQKPNGNFLIIGSEDDAYVLLDDKKQTSGRDIILELTPQGQLAKRYDLKKILNPHRNLIVKNTHLDLGKKLDWCHINGISYEASSQSILTSCRHFGIVKIDEKTSQVKWLITPHRDLDKSGIDGKGPTLAHKVLTAVDKNGVPYSQTVQEGRETTPDFKWPTVIHNVFSLGNGLYSVYDNSGRVYAKDLKTTQKSVASIFKVDEKNHTVSQFFKKELDVYSDVGSAVHLLNNNQIIVYSARVFNKNYSGTAYGDLRRYDLTTGKELMHAVIFRGGVTYHYRLDPFDFSIYNTK